MDVQQELNKLLTRRQFFGRTGNAVGAAALASLLAPCAQVQGHDLVSAHRGLPELPHFPPRASRVIFLHQSGAPSQIDLFDPKPQLQRWHGTELADNVRMGQLLTTMTSEQKIKPVTASAFKFAKHGRCGTELSELLPYTANVVDDLCVVRTMHTEAINHDPGVTFVQTGSQQPGRPSIGAWVSYGIGSENQNLPAFIVLVSGGVPRDQPLSGRLWGTGFLPSRHQGVRFRAAGDPVLYINSPPGITRQTRKRMVDSIAALNRIQFEAESDPAINAAIEQYELAYRMQFAVPELTDLTDEPEHVFELYGNDSKKPGTYAANCLLARRLAERGVRFIQLYHRGWDHHEHLPVQIRTKCEQTDQASAALVHDLKQRGLLDDTLIVWAGEFGRTVYCQGDLAADDYGRDHHPRCFSIWMSGGGVKRGLTVGKTDDFSYNILDDPIHVHDLQATMLYCLGIDHEKLTFRFQGRDYRLTDIGGEVVHKILA